MKATDTHRQIALLVGLQVIAAAIFAGPMLVAGGLVGDRLATFYFFRDALHSLNVHGEFAWWNPSIWRGFPFYYLTFLYWPGRDPLFAVIAGGAWLLGQLGITIESYHGLFVVYITLLVPLLLSLSVLALARQLLRRRPAIYLVIAMSAFSPGVVFSLSDFGVEVSAYGFFFAASVLHFVRMPARSRFVLMCLPAMAMAAATFVGLFWNLFFVPAFVAAISWGRGALTRRASVAFRSVPAPWWMAAAAAVAIYALPSFVAFSHGGGIVSVRADSGRFYAYEELRPGTPLEALAISTPGVGFEWTDYDDPRAALTPRAVSRTSGFSSFGYMGLLTLPLVCLGLVFGRPYWSLRLFAGIAGVLTIVLLSAYSPILTLFVGWPTPLRGINHHSDVVVRTGLFAVFTLAAGLGLEAVLRPVPSRRWAFAGLAGITSLSSVIWLARMQGGQAGGNYLFGLALAFVLLYGIALARLAIARRPADVRAAVLIILALTVLDTSAFAFAHLRLSLPSAGGRVREPGSETIGSVRGVAEERVFYLSGLGDHAVLTPPARAFVMTTVEGGHPVADEAAVVVARSYNATTIRANAPVASRLIWHDAYFSSWRAWVNGAEVPIERTADGMKAVAVPAGTSDVRFRFLPEGLRAATAAAYLAFAAAALLWFAARRADTTSGRRGSW